MAMTTATANRKPTFASLAPYAQMTSLRTDLSFLLPASLAAFPSPTWLQTPWSPSFAPLSSAHVSAIAHHFSLDPSAVANALPFGSTPGQGPDVFVIFPNSTTDNEGQMMASTDENFLRTWHDQILKPAFDRSWHDSAQASISGAFKNAFVHILPGSGVHTSMDAHPFSGFLSRLRNGTPGHVSAPWPSNNPKVMNEAWDAIKGMTKGHSDLKEYQDPILLAVQRDEIWFGEQVGAGQVYEAMGKEWDGWVDGEFVEEGGLKVVLEVVVGVKEERRIEEVGVGSEFKRMAESEEVEMNGEGDCEDGDEGGHRAKRRRVDEVSEEARGAEN